MNGRPTVLLLHPDRAQAAQLAGAFTPHGIGARYVAEVAKCLEALRKLQPQLLLLLQELRDPATEALMAALAADVAGAQQPVALFAQDVSELRYTRAFRSGVVHLFSAPFDDKRHPRELSALLMELPERTGTFSSRADSQELVRLLEHLRRTRRSGVLKLDEGTPSESEALFAAGALRSARHRGFRGTEALAKMVALPSAAYAFRELGASAAPEVVIPIEELVVPETPTPQPVTAPAAQRPLLLVDDDPALCQMFGLLFGKHGFHVTVANDGLAGYERALREPFVAVVADLNMPRLDGWGLLRLLRDDFRTRELPLAFLSCHDDYRESLRALDAGAQAYYPKSLRLEALVKHVGELLLPRQEQQERVRRGELGPVDLAGLGPQWLLSQLEHARFSGTLRAQDSWARYELHVLAGAPVHAVARSGPHEATGERAFNALVASRGARGELAAVGPPQARTLDGSMSEQLAHAVEVLNANEKRVREGLLVNASQIQVDEQLYQLYAQVGPRQWLEAARLICEDKLPPREVIARVELSPVEIEETLRDLIRRGVIRLST